MAGRFGIRWGAGDARALEGLLVVGIVLTVVFGVAAPLVDGLRLGWFTIGEDHAGVRISADLRDPVPVPGTSAPGGALGADTPGPSDPGGRPVRLSGAQQVDVTFIDPSAGQRFAFLVGPLLLALTALAVLVLLLAIARTLRRGEPFTTANARRVSAIGILVSAAGTVGPLATQMANNSLLASSAAENLVETTTFSLSFIWLVVGFVIIAVGEIFRRGVVLRQDVDGLV